MWTTLCYMIMMLETLFENVSLYLAPMINPDGVNLVTGIMPKYTHL
jgi:murein tripeptide amidase MpaA